MIVDMYKLSIGFCLLLLGAGPLPAANDTDAAWAKLRAGGVVALVRHADAPGGAGDPQGFKLEDCATQRNLSGKGRAQARALGERIRAEHVTVGKLLVSQWCRCRDTASLMTIGAADDAPTFNNALTLRDRRESLTEGARGIVAGWKGPGTLVVVTHGANILALTGIQPVEAEMIVVEPAPDSERKFRLIGRIPPQS
jgi:phosphohistidine phosphatase SixA